MIVRCTCISYLRGSYFLLGIHTVTESRAIDIHKLTSLTFTFDPPRFLAERI
jgi:hypothetical protein